jgi:hypothetical protein
MYAKLFFRLMEIYHDDQYYRKTIFLYRSVKSFSFKTIVYDIEGKEIKVVNEVALNEIIPKGFMATRTGKEIWDGETTNSYAILCGSIR